MSSRLSEIRRVERQSDITDLIAGDTIRAGFAADVNWMIYAGRSARELKPETVLTLLRRPKFLDYTQISVIHIPLSRTKYINRDLIFDANAIGDPRFHGGMVYKGQPGFQKYSCIIADALSEGIDDTNTDAV